MKKPNKNKPNVFTLSVAIAAFGFIAIRALLPVLGIPHHSQAAPQANTHAHGFVLRDSPRNISPMEEYTQYFTKNVTPIDMGTYQHSLTYFWFAPAKPYPPDVLFPLVVVLHGAPGNAYAAKYLIASGTRTKFPAFVMAPVISTTRTWMQPISNAEKDASFALNEVVKLIGDLKTQYPIDPTRIYVIGCSEGGMGTFGAAQYYPSVFAAGVSIMGSWPPESATQMNKMPLWIITGSKDTMVPPESARTIAAIAKKNEAPVHYTEIPNMGHQCPSPTLYGDQLWTWLFSQKLKMTAGQ